MIRIGSVEATAERLAATIRGTRDRLAGYRRAVIALDARDDGASNEAVMGHLLRMNPGLAQGLDAEARAGARTAWRGARSSLETLTFHAGVAFARALSARLLSGQYVTNSDETRARKARRGGGVGGVDTRQLADALANPTVTVE